MIKGFNEYYSVKLYTEISYDEYDIDVYGDLINNDIDTDEYRKYVLDNYVDFTDREISILNNINPLCGVIKKSKGILDIASYGYKKNRYIAGDIHKLKDDWFYITYAGIYYKCDQIDGLIQCIKDNKILKYYD